MWDTHVQRRQHWAREVRAVRGAHNRMGSPGRVTGHAPRRALGLMSWMTLLVLVAQLLPATPALLPTAQAAGVRHGTGKQVPPLKSKMQTRFAPSIPTGENCAGSAPSPLIYNCAVSAMVAGSATIVWESDVQATATVCVNTAAYPLPSSPPTPGQCVINNGGAYQQCNQPWGVNPGFTLLDDQVGKQQLPTGNWSYAAIVPLQKAGTFHYQISLQNSSGQVTTSLDESFAVPSLQPDFQENFGGAATASSPYASQSWQNAPAEGSGPVAFQDAFSSGTSLSSSWNVVQGSWMVIPSQGVATASGPAEAYETPFNLGSTAGAGELVTTITLPTLTTQPYDNAGLVIYEDPSSPNQGKVLLVLNTDSNCQVSGTGCSSGELASGLWLSYTFSGTTHNVSLAPSFTGTFAAGQAYTIDIRVSGPFVSVFDRTAPTNPWQYVVGAVATTTVNSDPYTISQGPAGLWDNATTPSAVQFGAFTIYNTVTVPSSGVAPNPTTNTIQAVYDPNSTVSQSLLRGVPNNPTGTPDLPLGVAMSQDNDEVDFTAAALGGIVVRSTSSGAGDAFTIAVNANGGIQGYIDGTGSQGVGSGASGAQTQWDLEARFDGSHLSLYAQDQTPPPPQQTNPWVLLAVGYSATTSGTTVWPLPTANGTIGAFSLRQITSGSLQNWVETGNAAVATTSNDPNTPGTMLLKHTAPDNVGQSTSVYTTNVNLGDGTLVIPFEVWNPDLASLMFRYGDNGDNYQISFYTPLGDAFVHIQKIFTFEYRGQVFTFTPTIAAFHNTCTVFGGAGPYTAYITMVDQSVCVALAPGLYGTPVAETCFTDPSGRTGGGIGISQGQNDIALVGGIKYYSGRDPNRWFGPGGLAGGVSVGFGTYSEQATDLAFSGKQANAVAAQSAFPGQDNVPQMAFAGRGLPLVWSRSYNSSAAAQGFSDGLGYGWFTSYGRTLTINGDSSVSIATDNGTLETFALDTANNTYTPPAGSFETLVHNGDGSFTLTTRARVATTWQVVNAGGPYLMTKQVDADGNVTTLSYAANNTLTGVQDAVGRQLTFTYNTQPIGSFAAGTLITAVSDRTRTVVYGYDNVGNLNAVTDPDGFTTTYTYGSSLNAHLLTERCDANTHCVQNTYAIDPNWDPAQLKFTPSGGFRIIQQTDPTGVVSQFTYDTVNGQPVQGQYQVIRDPGAPPHLNQTATYQINSKGEATSFTDPNGVVTDYCYNGDGLMVGATADASLPDQNQGAPLTLTCPSPTPASGHLNLTTQRTYDTRGNLTETIDPNGRTVSYAYGTDPTAPDYDQPTQVIVDPVPPSGGTHLNATYTIAYYPQSAPPTGFTGNPGDVYSVADPLNHTTLFSYNSAGQVVLEADANGHYTSYTYDAYGQQAQVVVDPPSLDPYGLNLTTSYQYDSIGRLQQETDPNGITTAYTYDNDFRLLQTVVDPYNASTNPNGLSITTTSTYDKVGNLLSQTLDPTPRGGITCSTAYGGLYRAHCHMNETTTYTYDNANRVTKVVSPINGTQVTYPGASSPTTLSGVTTYSYDAAGDKTSETDPLGHTTVMAYDPDGHLLQETNALDGTPITYPDGTTHTISGTTTFTYDAAGRVTQVVDPMGEITEYSYDNTQDITGIVTDPSGADLRETRTYDSAGRMVTDTDARGDTTSYAYDANGHVLTVQLPLGEQASTTYDAVGNVATQVIDPGQGHANIVTQYIYDAANRLTSQIQDPNPPGLTGHLHLTTGYLYDADGRVLQVTDPNGHSTKYGYDRIGRQTSVTDAHAVATGGPSWRFTYDAAGNQRQTTDPLGHVTTTQYNVLNQPIQQVIDPNPLGGGGHLSLTSAQYYDSDGNVVYSTNANGQTTAYTYDALNRLTTTTYHSATTPDVAYFYDDDGRQLYMTDGTGPAGTFWKATYDLAGRLTAVTDPNQHTVAYGYDANGNLGELTSETYPNGQGLAMTYDLDGRPATLSSPNNGLFGSGTALNTTSFQYTYDSANRLSQVSYPNGIVAGYGYDTAGRMTSKTAMSGTTTVGSWSYQLDNDGNPTTVTDSASGPLSPITYSYDEANRLLQASYGDGSGLTYTYDAAGNRTSQTSTPAPGCPSCTTDTTGYSYDAAGRLVTAQSTSAGATTYGYDKDGNRTSASAASTTTYTYDQADRLIGVSNGTTSTSYTYNGEGQRASATTGGDATVHYQWDPLSGALLSDGSNEYVASAAGGLLVQTPVAGGASAALFGVPDNLGSTRVLTNASGQTQSTTSYDPFGVPNGGSGSATSPLGYTGQLTDSSAASGATGFEDLRARMYDPSTGQFLQRDSYAGSMGNAGTLNHYTYAGDSPTVSTDPGGHDPICIIICFDPGAILGGLATGLLGGLESGGFGFGISAIPGLGPMLAIYSGLTPGTGAFTHLDPHAIVSLLGPIIIGLAAGLLAVPVIGWTLDAIGIGGAAAIILGGILVGAISGVAGQAYSNAINGRPLSDGLGEAALTGATFGGAFGIVAAGFSGAFDAAGADGAALGDGLGAEDGAGAGAETGADATATDAGAIEGGAEGEPCSFAASTLVATPIGERAIGSLKVGDQVLAYNPTTGQTDTEPVQHVWINHDHDLVDVGLMGSVGAQNASATSPSVSATSGAGTAPTGIAPTKRSSRLSRMLPGVVALGAVALAVTLGTLGNLGSVVSVFQAAPVPVTATSSSHIETIHTTANHPWLTADRGWVEASNLQPGEQVVTLSGGTTATETVAWVHVVASQADMYNLTVAQDHTYAVGNGHVVVHNVCFNGQSGNTDAAEIGKAFHYDRFNTGEADNYGGPSQLRDIYPNTEFRFTPPFEEGPDVEVIGGQHPSTYGRGNWPTGADIADFKPATKSGRYELRRAIRYNPAFYPPDTVPIWYDQSLYQIVGIGW